MESNSKQQLKIELMPDNRCLIEIRSKENNSILSSIQMENITKSNNIISTSKDNQNKSQNNISNLNDSDILSISKTDSSISANSNNENKKQQNNNSNMLISFSNISEANKTNINLNENSSLLTNSIIFNKEKENKEDSFTPSTLCNYYQKSNNNTPISSNRNNKSNIKIFNINNNNNNNNIHSYRVNQRNLNNIFSEMNSNSNEVFNVSKKKTPIKYTKSQLSNHDEGNNEIVEQKNLLSLFEKTNKGKNKSNELKIEYTNKIEILNNTSSGNSNSINRCSYFSFCNNKQLNTNNFFNTSLTNKSNNENNIFNESDYISPKFNYSIDKNEQMNTNLIPQINLNKNNSKNNKEKSQKKENSSFVKNINNSNIQKSLVKHIKYTSSFTLPNKHNNSEQNINPNQILINKERNNNLIKQHSTSHIHQNRILHSSNKNKSKSKEKKNNEKNDLSKLKTMREKIENIISKNISLLTKKPIKINNKKSRSPSLKIQRPKSANKTINFINNIKPLSFITNKNQNIELKDIMKLKLKYSPSPSNNIRNNIKNINLRKENSINKKRNVIEVSPSITHNDSSSFCESNSLKTNSNLKTFTNVNTACNSGKLNSPSDEVSTKKKKLKVIQNFSKYKKRSVINEIDYKNNLNKNVINNYNISDLGKNKPVFSNKVNKIHGDEDNINFNLDDF